MVDWVSLGIPLIISLVAILFAALTWLESRRARELLETMVKALPYAVRRRKKQPRKPADRAVPGISPTSSSIATTALPIPAVPVAKPLSQAEERRRIKLQLEREKLEWQKNRDVARAIAWFLDRMTEDDNEEYDE